MIHSAVFLQKNQKRKEVKAIKFLIFLSFYTLIILYFVIPKIPSKPHLILENLIYASKNGKDKFMDLLQDDYYGSSWFIKKDGNFTMITDKELFDNFKDQNLTIIFGVYNSGD